MIKMNSAVRLAHTRQTPSLPQNHSAYEDHSSEEILADGNPIIAPTEDYRRKDEQQLTRQQDSRQTEENKEATSPGSSMSKTAVKNNDNLKTTSAVTPNGLGKEDLPATGQQYASKIEDAPRRSESTKLDTLYDTTASLVRLIASSNWGGIEDSEGDSANLDFEGIGSPKPNSQVLPYNGSLIKADRLGTESDPLTKDQENFGTHAKSPAFADTVPMLMDPSTVSSYSRDNSLNRNTTEKELAHSTVDEPEPADNLNLRGQEGLETFANMQLLASTMRAIKAPHDMAQPATKRPSKGYSKPGLEKHRRKLNVQSKSLYDGDFDPAGRATGDHMITENPDNHGYLNLHAAMDEDIEDMTEDMNDSQLAALCDAEEIDADADPRIFNMANQPLGMAG